MLRRTREEFAQEPRGCALANPDTAGDPDYVGHLGRGVPEEGNPSPVEDLLGFDVQAQQAGEWQVDGDNLVHPHPLVESLETQYVYGSQRQRGIRAEPSPLGSCEPGIRRPGLHDVSPPSCCGGFGGRWLPITLKALLRSQDVDARARSSSSSWRRRCALPTSESESIVQGRPSMSDTVPSASVMRRLPAAV